MHFLPLWPPQVSVEKVRSSELTVWHQANAVLLLCNCKIKVIRESITPKFVSSTHIEATLWCTVLFSLTSELLILNGGIVTRHKITHLAHPVPGVLPLVSLEQGTQAISLPASHLTASPVLLQSTAYATLLPPQRWRTPTTESVAYGGLDFFARHYKIL